jgi:hypothetical protein
MTYSSNVAEQVQGKGTIVDSAQYYTETNATQHSGLTYVIKDKKRKWSVDTYIVTRMQEDTSAGTKTVRSVTEVGTTQYIIDKVDITMASGKISYTSSQDIYNTALPRGGDPKAKDYVALDVLEDDVGAGTFTGTMKETQADQEIVRDVTIARDNLYRFAVKMKYKSTGARPKALADSIEIPLTRQDLSNMSISLPAISGTFTGYYEAGNLFGTISTTSGNFEVVVAEEGVAVNDVLYPY